MSEPQGSAGSDDAGAGARKRYLERVAEIGARSEKVGLPILAGLLLLFFGFILPSARVVDQVRRLRAQHDANTRVERRIRALERTTKEEWGARRVIRLSEIVVLPSLKTMLGEAAPRYAAE